MEETNNQISPQETEGLPSPNIQETPDPTEDKSYIDKAVDAADRIDKGLIAYKELLDRQEILLAKSKISGRSSAGEEPRSAKEIEEEEIDKQVKEALSRYNK